MLKRLLIALYLSIPFNCFALETDAMFLHRSAEPFPETMASLQQAIVQQGYTISRVQHVDVGLNAMGFNTDPYRVVFFGKVEEIHLLSQKHPELIPYLPLQITIFAEANETLLTSINPLNFKAFYPDPQLAPLFTRWHEDIQKIFRSMQTTH